jgi:hypothetical protein
MCCFFVIHVVLLLIVMFCVLLMCKCVLPPGVNPIAVDKYISIKSVKLGSSFTYFCNSLNHCFFFQILLVTSIGNALFFTHQNNQVFRSQFLLGFFQQNGSFSTHSCPNLVVFIQTSTKDESFLLRRAKNHL